MKRFAITGVAGYVAPRHLRAIRDTGNTLVAAFDPHDSVGLLDHYFWNVAYFRDFERFDRHLEMLRRSDEGIDFLTICSPNHLHDAHVRLALRLGSDAICEKPLVLNPWNLDALAEIEEESGNRVHTILQLRLHPSIQQLRERISSGEDNGRHRVRLTYITGRGPWYTYSWKGNIEQSGGVATNIGIHFFDMLMWLFGDVRHDEVHLSEPRRMAGALELERADVEWFLSVESSDLPFDPEPGQRTTYRAITVDGDELEFTTGFTDLHTASYQEILAGRGFGIEEARASVELVHRIRTAPAQHNRLPVHPLAARDAD